MFVCSKKANPCYHPGMFSKCMLLALLAGAAGAQPTLSITGPAQVKAGNSITLAVNLTGSAGSNEAGLQWTLTGAPWGTWKAVIMAGPSATSAGKGVQCAATGSSLTCLLFGLNSNLLVDGQVASIQLTLPVAGPLGPVMLNWSGLIGATVGGSAGPVVSAGPFPLLVLNSPCDLNLDGKINTSDRTDLLGQIFGIGSVVLGGGGGLPLAVCSNGDLNADGACNILDLQILVGAIVSGVCPIM